jgi:hypothetical protein
MMRMRANGRVAARVPWGGKAPELRSLHVRARLRSARARHECDRDYKKNESHLSGTSIDCTFARPARRTMRQSLCQLTSALGRMLLPNS